MQPHRFHAILFAAAILLVGCGDDPASPNPSSHASSADSKKASAHDDAPTTPNRSHPAPFLGPIPSPSTSTSPTPSPSPTPGPTPAPSPNHPPRESKTITTKIDTALPIAFGLPRVVAFAAVSSRSMIVEAVYAASQLSGGSAIGQVVSVGTLTLTQQGPQYQPQPADKLIVKLNGQTHEFVLKQANGNTQAADAMAWLASPHVLQYTHRIPDEAEAEVNVRFDGTRFDVKIVGWIKAHGHRYDLSLASAGQSAGNRGFDGQELQTQYTLTGKITSNDIEVDVHEAHSTSMASAISPRLLHSQRGSASKFNATISNTFRCDGDTYKFEGVQVQTEQKEKGGQSSSSTELAGNITRNKKPFATCTAKSGATFATTTTKTYRLDGAN